MGRGRAFALGLLAVCAVGVVVAPARDGSGVRAATPGAAGQIVAGVGHTCVIAADNRVMCWGDNQFGQLGDSAFPDASSSSPVATSGFGGRTPVQLAAGRNHTCARMSDATVWCWGDNTYAQLGNAGGTSVDPVQVTLGSTATWISASGNTSCARTTAQLICWGRNNKGQLGLGTTYTGGGGVAPTAAPAVPGTFDAVSLSGGFEHTCAASAAGEVWCWGEGGRLQLGSTANSTVDQTSPQRTDALGDVASRVVAGDEFSCAHLGNSSVWCWGDNSFGQLGRGSTSPSSSSEPTAVAGTGNAMVVAAGGKHACAVTSAGTVRCWGRNNSGQVGDASVVDAHSPQQVSGVTGTAVDAATGGAHSCAVLQTGAVSCWGDNSFGQLGTGDTATRNAATPVVGLSAIYTTTTTTAPTTTAPSTVAPTTVPPTTAGPTTVPPATTTSTTTTMVITTTTAPKTAQSVSPAASTGTRT
ncbi:MAG: RCC1 domain-containing protein, partial [Ilumatobacteraceae bacterium]